MMSKTFFGIIAAAIVANTSGIWAEGPLPSGPGSVGCSSASQAQLEIRRIEAPPVTVEQVPASNPAPTANALSDAQTQAILDLQEGSRALSSDIRSLQAGMTQLRDSQNDLRNQVGALDRKVENLSSQINRLQSGGQQSYYAAAPTNVQSQSTVVQVQPAASAAPAYYAPQPSVAVESTPWTQYPVSVVPASCVSPTYPANYPTAPAYASTSCGAGCDNGGGGVSANFNFSFGGSGRDDGGRQANCLAPARQESCYNSTPTRAPVLCGPRLPSPPALICPPRQIGSSTPFCGGSSGGGSRGGGGSSGGGSRSSGGHR